MYYYGRDKKRRFRRRIKFSLITLGVIGFIAISYFVYSNFISSANIASVDPVENSFQARRILADKLQNRVEKGKYRNDNIALNAKSSVVENVAVSATENTDRFAETNFEHDKFEQKDKNKSVQDAYEVISKAHFYNHPSEQSRRKEFIPYWNMSYASIKPIEEKNGFIYVVFKYPSGEKSKGWLRKKDLHKVNIAYGDSKG